MRSVFGYGRVVALDGGGWGLECLGLHRPMQVVGDYDLSAHAGAVIAFQGELPIVSGNLELPMIDPFDLNKPQEECPITAVTAVVGGNLGSAPAINPKGDRISGSIAYDKPVGTEQTSWLRIAAYAYFSAADCLAQLDQGSSVIAFGQLESYVYKNEDRLQLNLLGLQRRYISSAPKPPENILKRDASASLEPPVDAFTGAA